MSFAKIIEDVFSFPEIIEDEQLQHARVFTLVCGITIFTLGVFIFYYGLFDRSYNIIPMVVLLLAAVISLVLNNRGSTDMAVNLLVWAVLIGLLTLATVNGGLTDTALQTLPALLIVAALLLGRLQLILFSTVSLLSLIVLGMLQINHIILNQTLPEISTTDVFDLLVIDGATVFLVMVVSIYLKKNFRIIKRGKELLSKSEERFQSLYENSTMGLYRTTPGGTILLANPALVTMLRYSSFEELSARNLENEGFEPSYERKKFIEQIELHGEVRALESAWTRQDGSIVFVRENARAIRDSHNKTLYYDGTVEDITERKVGEKALTLSELRYRRLFESSKDGILILDVKTGKITDVNPFLIELLGYSKEQFIEKTIWEIGFFKDIITNEDKFFELQQNEYVRYENLPLETADGRTINVEFVSNVYTENDHNVIQCNIRNITERKKLEEALRENSELFTMFMRYSPIYTYIKEVTPTQSITMQCSENFQNMTGIPRSEMIGKSMAEVFPAEFAAKITEDDWSVVSKGDVMRLDEELNGRSYTTIKFPLSLGDKKILAGYTIDITERKNSEQALRNAQKLESIGVLASGIAHDFNNLLTAMIGNVSLAQMRIPVDHPSMKNLSRTLVAMESAATLTKQMLAYSGHGKFQTTAVDMVLLVKDHLRLFEVTLPKNVQLQMNLPPTSVYVNGDPGQMEQIVMNLIINGGEAIGESQGVVLVKVSAVTMKQKELLAYSTLTNASLEEGEYALLQVTDNGSGMSKETREKIFDPFFTTKFVGRGLGLSAVLGILRSHNGGIRVESTEGVGTTFQVILPLHKFEIETLQQKEQRRETTVQTPTVLLIDDEQYIIDMTEDVFSEEKYQILSAKDPVVGIKLYEEQWQRIEIVVLDFSMPKLNGKEVLAELRKINPDVKVIISSGYSEEELTLIMGEVKATAIIQKPYTPDALLSMINKVLEIK